MPQIGTSAILYLPDADGKGAIITGCIRKNGGECEKSGDPNIRYFGTEHGSEAKLSPTGIDIVSGSKEPLKLTLEDDNGITLTSHKKLLLQADSEIIIQSEKRVVIQAESQIMIVKTGQTSGIAIENEYHILGNQVIADGSDKTSYPIYDDAPQIGTPPPEPKPPFSWGKLVGRVLAGIAVVAAVVIVAVVVVATLGAGAAVIGAVAAGAAIAGTAAVVSQAASDIARGEVSGYGAYGWAALRESTIGAISGAIFGPFGAGAVIGGKMTFGAVVNGFESVIRQTMEGEGFSLETLMNDAAIGALTAGLLDSRIVKGIGGAVVKKISSVAPWIQKGIGAVGQQFSKKVDDLSKFGNKMGQKYMKEARELLDDVATSIKQAGNKLAGPMPVHLGPNVDLPNSNVWKSSDPRQQQKFWDEMEQGKKELAERMSKNAEGTGNTAKEISEAGQKILNNGDSLDSVARNYIDQVKTNKRWTWTDDIPGAEKLTKNEKIAIKEYAVKQALIEDVPIKTIVTAEGKKCRIADFNAAGVVKETKQLPEELWKASDAEQFKWLDEAIGGRPSGTTWHHSEFDGKMELVPFGIHNITNHNGGRTKGLWSYRVNGR
ncbi:HNH endonuclease [Paenibacillus glacialis]|uniref:Tox-GHH domain-containing protein n=1 Tax=Paenibacillus glacialis TaxID=494026 RepID=A0A168N899_9BACL|nr:HNH endonuclease [Paenibacillus glacialis]OAB45511.1 hypothetical protein PGLA_04475 [Paenibacillus glacialis]